MCTFPPIRSPGSVSSEDTAKNVKAKKKISREKKIFLFVFFGQKSRKLAKKKKNFFFRQSKKKYLAFTIFWGRIR